MSSQNIFLLYLHGFNSSPLSFKARATFDYWNELGQGHNIAVPELPYSPREAIDMLSEIIEYQKLPVALIGSSLGGYYATYLAERYDLRAVLVNPAVNPVQLWGQHLGVNTNYYSGKRFSITREHVSELAQIDTPSLQYAKNYLLLAQTGDETLDYRLAVDKYHSSMSIITQGGNHSFEGYEALLPQIYQFLTVGL